MKEVIVERRNTISWQNQDRVSKRAKVMKRTHHHQFGGPSVEEGVNGQEKVKKKRKKKARKMAKVRRRNKVTTDRLKGHQELSFEGGFGRPSVKEGVNGQEKVKKKR